jgi:RimJ/RimL family protein N-acetyltransferase
LSEVTVISKCKFRRATHDDFRVIYDMQNVPYRDQVFANELPKTFEEFEEVVSTVISQDKQRFFILERDGSVAGFSQFFMAERGCEIIVWGRWLKTLMFASLKVAFDVFGVEGIQACVRTENKRVNNAYAYFSGREVKRELTAIRQSGMWGKIKMVGHITYHLTREEFREKEEMFRQQAMEIEIVSD